MIVVCRRERETVSFVRILVIAWIVSAKQGAMDAALASERGIVDVETLRKVNADIILSINEVVKIHEEGSKRRAEAQEELARIEDEWKQALLEAGNR